MENIEKKADACRTSFFFERTARNKRTLERDGVRVRGEGTPAAHKVLIRDQVAAEDDDTELGDMCRLADESDETVPSAHTAVKSVMLPRLTMTRDSL